MLLGIRRFWDLKMARLDMDGPFDLKNKVIDNEVSAGQIGNYALGFLNKKGKFVVKVVGRSDESLRDEIKAACKKYSGGVFSRLFGGGTPDKFKYSFANDVDTAFQVECRLFETFGGTEKLLNEREPTAP
jgi:hypothetical protein